MIRQLLATVAIGATFFPPLPAGQPHASQAGIHLGSPPVDAWRSGAGSRLVFNDKFRARVRLDTPGKAVSILWSYNSAGTWPAEESSVVQRQATSYWPTAVDCVASNKLLVAGKERSGNTRIEIWTLTKPLLVAGTGGQGVALTQQAPSDITVVYDEATVGRDMVRGIIKKRGPGSKALIHFFDSGDLYELDWGAEPFPCLLLLSHTSHSALTANFDTYRAGNHSTHGYVYLLSNLTLLGTIPPFVLRDTDRNGSIDIHGVLTDAEFINLGLNDVENYIEFGGLQPPE